jgi:tetratricopeptide (TPR) repeat protein
LRTNNKSAAAEQLEAIVRDNPTHYPSAWHFLGTIAYDEKKLTDAERNFEKALLLDPQLEQAYYDLALVQIDLHKTDDALKTLEHAHVKFPNSFIGEFFTGLAQMRLKDYAEAVKHFAVAETLARAKEPKRLTHQFYFQIGAACERNKDYKQAEEYFEKCIKEAPEFGEALNYLGYMWAERGENLPRARELIEKAVKLEPKNPAYLDSLGWVLFKQEHPQQALPYLLKAQELSPEPDPAVLDHLGDVYMALHDQEKARECWKKSLSIESNEEIKKKLESSGGKS